MWNKNRKFYLDIKQLKTAGGIPVEEAIACTIGKLGENISFTSAHLLYSHDDAFVYGVAHPQGNFSKLTRVWTKFWDIDFQNFLKM